MNKLIPAAVALSLSLMAAAAACADYTVHCVDTDGAPVAGAKIQLCTDDQCMMKKSGADGDAVFQTEPGAFSIHAYKVPEGYEAPEEIKTQASDPDATLVFPKAGAAEAEKEKIELWSNTYSITDDQGQPQEQTVKVSVFSMDGVTVQEMETAENSLADGYFATFSREGVAPVTVAITPACIAAHANLNQATDEQLQTYIDIVGEQYDNPTSEIQKTENGNVYISAGTDTIRSVWTIYEDTMIEIIQHYDDCTTPLTKADQAFAVEVLQSLSFD